MRSLALALALLVAACSTTLQTQALVVVTASQVVATAGQTIQAQSDAAFAAATSDDQRATIYARWSPVVASYARVRSLVLAYQSAIAKADADGDKTILAAPAQALVSEWVKLAALADDAGIKVAGPPEELTSLAGGS